MTRSCCGLPRTRSSASRPRRLSSASARRDHSSPPVGSHRRCPASPEQGKRPGRSGSGLPGTHVRRTGRRPLVAGSGAAGRGHSRRRLARQPAGRRGRPGAVRPRSGERRTTRMGSGTHDREYPALRVSPEQARRFLGAYGFDVTSWRGFPVFRRTRELIMLPVWHQCCPARQPLPRNSPAALTGSGTNGTSNGLPTAGRNGGCS
jgi:hypothetical protein